MRSAALKRLVKSAMAVNRGRRPVEFVYRQARALVHAAENNNFDSKTNGEYRMLEKLRDKDPTCLFDVGANQGTWTKEALGRFPRAQAHCFEVLHEPVARARVNLAGLNVRLNEFGLMDKAGTIKVKEFVGFSELSSIGDVSHPWADSHWTEVLVSTGDRYMADHGIRHVDILKIDVEGSEMNVLGGFDSALDRGAIDVIQFEYGRPSIFTRTFLKDFFEYLVPHGYSIGKIFPRHVQFFDYDTSYETFISSNFVAVRSELDELKRRLGQRF